MIWGSSQELYAYIYIPYRCKVEQPDALQHNGMITEMEICMWKLGVLLRVLGSCFPRRMETHHTKSEVNRQYFLQILSEN